MLRRVVLVRTDVSDELSAVIIRVTRIGELGTTLAVTGNRCTPQRNIPEDGILQENYLFQKSKLGIQTAFQRPTY
jgi:hypothetical protein